ncbi:MAG: UDP-N-acetylmuramoyl-L-alanine--D-glutamate ligase [Endomicrobiaceae bacterium]|nr:UDP-N-acetylmuramoyl-L-alanine--D-glutamate ligase [Endomicrobiaceae bacterium]
MKKISVLGLGKSGIACANLACNKGFKVFASDCGKPKTHLQMKLNKKVKIEFNKHSNKVLDCDLIIKSPGLSSDLPILTDAVRKKIPVISEIDFALSFVKPKKVIAITGTNGKTTTTTLTYKIIKYAYKNTVVAGNIGYPLSSVANKINKNTILVLELSSYQLEDFPKFKPNISVLLNITPDHIKHHKTMKNYIKAKSNIFKNQTGNDFTIFNYKDKYLKKLIALNNNSRFPFNLSKSGQNCIYYKENKFHIQYKKKKIDFEIFVKIPGRHNIDNILASIASAYLLGIKIDDIKKMVSSFKGVEHRIEFVRNIRGVKYYNDSKSTNVDSTKVALESFDKNIHLILGGQDKGSSYKPIYKLIKAKVKTIMLIGEATPIIEKELKDSAKIYKTVTLENAIKQLQSIVKEKDIVLFSPACASFDQFENFEHRGHEFKKIILSIK